MVKKQDKIKEFNRLAKDNLKHLLLEKKNKMREFRFDLIAGKIKDVRAIREARKDIARINTILKTKSEN